MTDDLKALVDRVEGFDQWLREGGNEDVADLLRDLLAALLAQRAQPACCEPAPDRSGRQCDKPKDHEGPHWTYGGNTLTWEREAQPTPSPSCVHGHTSRMVGCVSCCLLFPTKEAP